MEAGWPLDDGWELVGVNSPAVAAELVAVNPAGMEPPVVADELMGVGPRTPGT